MYEEEKTFRNINLHSLIGTHFLKGPNPSLTDANDRIAINCAVVRQEAFYHRSIVFINICIEKRAGRHLKMSATAGQTAWWTKLFKKSTDGRLPHADYSTALLPLTELANVLPESFFFSAHKACCFLSYPPQMQKTKCSLFLCSSLLCIWKLLPCLCFIFSSTDCTDPISSIFHCRSCFLVLWSFSHWIIRTVWKEKKHQNYCTGYYYY